MVHGFDCVFGLCILIPFFSVFCVVLIANMMGNFVDYMFLIGIAVGARSVYMFVSTSSFG